ncbi:hypothetical protein V6V47_14155 [Micromonospora sp. CPCC 205539]|uniref:hypothetical protein n=1 Tax=Micromonospora sp. CPCC 205539 TaxID=3122408 RepID=UPI002FF345E1
MYVTSRSATSSQHADQPATTALRLAHVEHHVVAAGRPFDDFSRGYFQDLWQMYDLPWEEELFTVERNTFHDLVASTRWVDAPFELAIMASTTPDTDPVFPMAHLAERMGGQAFTFAVSDQGTAAPFTALRLAAESILPGPVRRALVLIVDQKARLHRSAVPASITPTVDAVAVLVLESAPGLDRVLVEQATNVTEGEVASRVAEAVSRAAADGGRVDLVGSAGWLAHGGPAAQHARHAADGMPCTGLWAAFAANLPRWRTQGRTVLLVDYDEVLRYLSICRVDVAAATRLASSQHGFGR